MDEVISPIKPMTEERVHKPVPPEAFFICSAIFHYLGPAFAVFVPLSSRTSAINLQWRDYRRLLLLLCYRFCLPQRAW